MIFVSNHEENMTKNAKFWLIFGGIGSLILLVAFTVAFDVVTVEGNQIGVKETWSEGVDPDPLMPKTYFLFIGQTIYTYDMSSQIFVMNDVASTKEKGIGREKDAYHVQSSEGQDMWISMNVRWRFDPVKIVHLHKTYRGHFEEKLIRPTVMLIVKNQATRRKAIEAFSGDSLVKLQTDIFSDLIDPKGELRDAGIIVENFVIEGIRLDEKYIGEIRARQVATQQKLRAEEETKAAEAMALKAQAEARADYNKRVVEAERDKQVGVLKAEEDAQKRVLDAEAKSKQVIIAAEADKKQVVFAAEAEKEAGTLKAQAIEALGKAEAEATKLRLSAYAVPGADAFVRIEIAKHMSRGFENIRGYLPANMSVNVLSENFLNSINQMMGGKPQPVEKPKN